MLGKIYDNFSDIPYNNELQQYEVFVGDQVYSGNIEDSEIQFSEEVTYATDDSEGYTQYIFTFAKPTTIYNHATIEIDSQKYIFEIKSRSVTVNRTYYSAVGKNKEEIFESYTYRDMDCPKKIKISTDNYKYYTTTDNNLDNNNQSFSISNDNQYIILNSEYDNIILSITYDRLLSAVSYYYYYGTTDEIPDLESESKDFYFLEQYKIKAPYIESFTAVYPAEDEHGQEYQEEDILTVPEDLQGGGSIKLYYFYKDVPYTLYIHQIKYGTNDEFEDTAQISNLPGNRVIVISDYIKEWAGYIYKYSDPDSNFEMQEKAVNYEVHLYLYYEENPKDPEEDPDTPTPPPEDDPPEEDNENIVFGWMTTNGKNKFTPKTLGENFITDAESKAKVFQYGTFIPSKLQKGAIYFVI